MRSILRPSAVFGAGNPLPVGLTKGTADYVLHDERDPFVPETTIPRLRPVPLGARAIGFFDDEVAALVEGLRKLRDDTPLKVKPPRKQRIGRASHAATPKLSPPKVAPRNEKARGRPRKEAA